MGVETPRDGERWLASVRARKWPEEPLVLHAAPMALLRMEVHGREDLSPAEEHLGLLVLLPGGKAGRLLAFERGEDGGSAYTLEGLTPPPYAIRGGGARAARLAPAPA